MIKSKILEILKDKSKKFKCKKQFFNEIEIEEIYNLTKFYHDDEDFNFRLRLICEDIQKLPTCETCGIEHQKKKHPLFSRFCSDRCRQNSPNKKITSKENFKRARQVFKEKNGVNNPFQCKEIQEKVKSTNKEKYGYYYPFQDKKIISDIHHKLRNRSDNEKLISKNKMITSFYKNKFSFMVGIEDRISYLLFQKNMNPIQISKELKVAYSTIYKVLRENEIFKEYHEKYIKNNKKSSIEYLICNNLDKMGITYKSNDRVILEGKELDILINDKLGIEINGLYWHSDDKKHKNSHINKLEMCVDKNIKLLQFWDYQVIEKTDIVMSMILSKLGLTEKIYARKCEIREVKESKEFLEKNHIQGNVNSKIKLGLYYNNELVALMTFGKPRFNKNYDWELLRYCSKINTTVVGGFSKILKHFRKNNEGSIISYANKMFSDGNVYKQNDFKFKYDTEIGYFYHNGSNILSRIYTQKHKLKQLLINYDENLTESENMFRNGYLRVWDCGNRVYELI